MSHVCSHCGLPTWPLAYHEGPGDCVDALKARVWELEAALEQAKGEAVAAALDAVRRPTRVVSDSGPG